MRPGHLKMRPGLLNLGPGSLKYSPPLLQEQSRITQAQLPLLQGRSRITQLQFPCASRTVPDRSATVPLWSKSGPGSLNHSPTLVQEQSRITQAPSPPAPWTVPDHFSRVPRASSEVPNDFSTLPNHFRAVPNHFCSLRTDLLCPLSRFICGPAGLFPVRPGPTPCRSTAEAADIALESRSDNDWPQMNADNNGSAPLPGDHCLQLHELVLWCAVQ
jgi:hypothetical protein